MLGTPEQEAMAKGAITSDIGYYLGCHYAALAFDSLLLGVIICQVTHWIPNARNDSPMVRLLVSIAVGAAVVAVVFTWAMYMYDFVYNYGTFFQFVQFRLLGAYGLMNIFTTIPVQLLFVERAIKVNGNSKIVAAISYFLAAATFAGGFAVFIETRGVTMLAVPGHVVALFQYWPTACLTAHLYNTTMIIYGLLKARSGNERADKLLKRLIRGCLEAQIPATTYAFVGMVVICNDPASPLIPFLCITHARVYLVGALAMVNSRHTWRKEGVTPQSYNNATDMTSAPNLTNSAPTASESQVSSNVSIPPRRSSKYAGLTTPERWPATPPWGLEVEMGLTEDSDAVKREAEKESDEEKRSSLTRLSFLGRGNN